MLVMRLLGFECLQQSEESKGEQVSTEPVHKHKIVEKCVSKNDDLILTSGVWSNSMQLSEEEKIIYWWRSVKKPMVPNTG